VRSSLIIRFTRPRLSVIALAALDFFVAQALGESGFLLKAAGSARAVVQFACRYAFSLLHLQQRPEAAAGSLPLVFAQ